MNISSLRSSVISGVGEFAITYPETWVMSWAMLGLATGVLLYAGLGYLVGAVFGQALLGCWCVLGFYAYTLAQSAERVNANIDHMVEQLKSLRSDVPF